MRRRPSKLLVQVFSIDIAVYATLSNHYHLILHINQHLAKILSLYQSDKVIAYLCGLKLTNTALFSMAANKEDNRTGNSGRDDFKSQALPCCMVYVDLNPIRAGVSHSLAGSDFTSIQERITALLGCNISYFWWIYLQLALTICE